MKKCRDCGREVSDQAMICPACGAPYPAREKWEGHGFEYRSKATVMGLPLVHISFKYRPNRTPVVARGVIAIGQFAVGFLTLSQFGIGVISVSQFTIAAYAIGQFAAAYSLIAQFGVYLYEGHGQMVMSIRDLFNYF